MLKFILRRMLLAIPIVIGVTAVTYMLISLAPGDPVTAMLDPEQMTTLGPEWVAERKAELGLDQPIPVRYLLWLQEVAQGNLGYSAIDRQPVVAKLGERLWPTLKLMLTALAIGIVVGIPVGIISAVKQYSALDYVTTILGLIMISVPSFFMALGGIYVLSLRMGWLPTSGMATIGAPPTFLNGLHHLILPAGVLGLAQAAPLIRYARSSMLEVIRQEYVRTARAKGIREQVVMVTHALPNALIPIITVIALGLPALIGGTVIIEQIFAWPGMGTLAISAIFGRDYPVLMGFNLFVALAIILSSLLADIAYAVVDPRIRYSD
jgi:peptide/nickel transport system permease protein